MKIKHILESQITEDDFDTFVDDRLKEEFLTVYEILERLDISEKQWTKIASQATGGADVEDLYVENPNVKSFIKLLKVGDAGDAFINYSQTREQILDSDTGADYKFDFNDQQSFQKDPHAYHGVSPRDF